MSTTRVSLRKALRGDVWGVLVEAGIITQRTGFQAAPGRLVRDLGLFEG